PPFDAGPRRDAGPRPDGGPDAGTDAAARDAAIDTDAGARRITIDGRLGASEWTDAPVYTTTASTSGTPFAGNELASLRALRDADRLYLAIGAVLTSNNAVLVYVDHDLGGLDGIVGTPLSLTDFQGALDSALSRDLFTPVDFRVDFAWGTTSMPLTAVDGDPAIGWRDVDTPSGLFTSVPLLDAPSVCGVDVCETAIDLDALGVAPGSTIALFVRLGARAGALSNQTLPQDDASAPDFVSTILFLDP
ncbi:MAG: hypothetical protein K8H88_19210, partial [Sandaracinaceae bacterium]|nr:hypothetical protein [Sandaracinaceae bacterium]